MSRRGFTITEVLIAAAMVAILAAMALPQFQRTTERSYWRSARDILETIYAGEQIYYLQADTYLAIADTSPVVNPDWRKIFMDDPDVDNTIPVSFVVGATATTFTATATRRGGPCNNRTQTLNQNRTVGGTWPDTGEC